MLPHKQVLIIAAVCISSIGISLAYKVSAEKRLQVENGIEISTGSSTDQDLADQKIIEALQRAKLESLGALASSTNPFDPSPKDNVSDRYTKDIFAAYAQFEQTGEAPNAEDIVNNADYLNTADIEKDKYTLPFLSVFSPTTSDEIKAYGNIFAKTYLDDLAPVNQNTALYSQDVTKLTPLYRKIGEDLMKIRVPAAVASAHLKIANDFIKQADAFLLVGAETTDPVKALLGLKVIREGMARQADGFAQITSYLSNNGIIYLNTEPGAFWALGTTTVSLPQAQIN